MTENVIYKKALSKLIASSSMDKNFYDEVIDSNIK